MKLYMHPVSTTSRPILLFAAESGIELETQVVDLMQGEHHQEPYISVNPNRLVPVLEDGDFVLTESSAILKYIAEKVGSAAYPSDLQKRARINERMDWFNTNFYREYAYHLVYPQVYPHHTREGEGVQEATLDWGKSKAAFTLQILNDHIIGNNKYVCGDEISIADYMGAQFVSVGELIRVSLDEYPNVKRWFESMKALPSWKQVNEVHEGFAASLSEKPFVAI